MADLPAPPSSRRRTTVDESSSLSSFATTSSRQPHRPSALGSVKPSSSASCAGYPRLLSSPTKADLPVPDIPVSNTRTATDCYAHSPPSNCRRRTQTNEPDWRWGPQSRGREAAKPHCMGSAIASRCRVYDSRQWRRASAERLSSYGLSVYHHAPGIGSCASPSVVSSELGFPAPLSSLFVITRTPSIHDVLGARTTRSGRPGVYRSVGASALTTGTEPVSSETRSGPRTRRPT